MKSADPRLLAACNGQPTAGQTYTMDLLANFHVQKNSAQPKHPHGNGQLDLATDLADGQMASVTIKLKGQLAFDGGLAAIQMKDPTQTPILCGLQVNGQTMTFNTFRNATVPNWEQYSLALIVPDPSVSGLSLAVLIDPVMDNDGIARMH